MEANKDADNARRELRLAMDFAGLKDEEPPREFTDRFHAGYVRSVMQSNSWLAVFMITDVFGQTARFNVPGSVAATNWSHRLPQTVSQLDQDPQLLARTKTFSRLADVSARVI